MPTAPSSPRWPRIVAEALREFSPAVAGVAPPLHWSSLRHAEDAMQEALRLPRAGLSAPAFLRDGQVDSWRRVMATLDQHGAALLAERVGTGKTWIALAVAARQRGAVVACVPAILRTQWEQAARRAGVAITCWTHERLSRGALPPLDAALVIIDEAHRFRQPATRRVRTLAPWLAGRRVLCCTATPIVNRLSDLVSLLHLVAPDDALAFDGLRRLTDLARLTGPPLMLRRLVIRSQPDGNSPPATARQLTLPPLPAEQARALRGVALIDTLQGSHEAGTRMLVRNVFLDALASSDAALLAALQRYRALLLHATDAGGSSRADLRRFAGAALDQLVFWALLPASTTTTELPLTDLPLVEAAIDRLRADSTSDDAWLLPLTERLGGDTPAICFTRHHATARLLRRRLGDDVAWISGEGAGIGPHRYARAVVLAAFGPERATWPGRWRCPRHLIATDVAAEGLDLQGAGQIVHVDLPWTATRMRQREGRLLRSGQRHAHVDIVTRMPAAPITSHLAPIARVEWKEALAGRWLTQLEEDATGCIAVDSGTAGMVPVARARCATGSADLAALMLQRGRRRGLLLLLRHDDGPWCPTLPTELPRHESDIGWSIAAGPLAPADEILRNATAFAIAWAQRRDHGWAPTLAWRVQHLARQAARRRDAAALERLDRLLHWVAGSPTLGDLFRADALAQLDDAALESTDAGPRFPTEPAHVRAVALILFRSDDSPLR